MDIDTSGGARNTLRSLRSRDTLGPLGAFWTRDVDYLRAYRKSAILIRSEMSAMGFTFGRAIV